VKTEIQIPAAVQPTSKEAMQVPAAIAAASNTAGQVAVGVGSSTTAIEVATKSVRAQTQTAAVMEPAKSVITQDANTIMVNVDFLKGLQQQVVDLSHDLAQQQLHASELTGKVAEFTVDDAALRTGRC